MTETEADWKIFSHPYIQQTIHLSQVVYHKGESLVFIRMLEHPRFIAFATRTNKRYLLAYIELFEALLDCEIQKRARKAKARDSFESSKFIEICREILAIC